MVRGKRESEIPNSMRSLKISHSKLNLFSIFDKVAKLID